MQSPRATGANHFALSGAALVVFGLYLSWPFAFSWQAVIANIASLAVTGIGWRLVVFSIATTLVAILMLISVGAICLAAGGSAWLIAAACRLGVRRASWFGSVPHTDASDAARPPALAASEQYGAPACPQCGAPMKLRAAQQGKNAGKAFWGCSRYPKCQTIQPAS